jgi:hypothetical protein
MQERSCVEKDKTVISTSSLLPLFFLLLFGEGPLRFAHCRRNDDRFSKSSVTEQIHYTFESLSYQEDARVVMISLSEIGPFLTKVTVSSSFRRIIVECEYLFNVPPSSNASKSAREVELIWEGLVMDV